MNFEEFGLKDDDIANAVYGGPFKGVGCKKPIGKLVDWVSIIKSIFFVFTIIFLIQFKNVSLWTDADNPKNVFYFIIFGCFEKYSLLIEDYLIICPT